MVKVGGMPSGRGGFTAVRRTWPSFYSSVQQMTNGSVRCRSGNKEGGRCKVGFQTASAVESQGASPPVGPRGAMRAASRVRARACVRVRARAPVFRLRALPGLRSDFGVSACDGIAREGAVHDAEEAEGICIAQRIGQRAFGEALQAEGAGEALDGGFEFRDGLRGAASPSGPWPARTPALPGYCCVTRSR